METKKKENNFLAHGAILAIAGILVRFIGMIYRIPMVNIIGSEGNGYYSNAYSVYNIILLLSSYSLPLAVSKIVSERVSKNQWKETKRVVLAAIMLAFAVGLFFGLLTYFGADFFCTSILNSPKSAIALKWLAPTVFVVAMLGVLRGFFQGLQTTVPTAISQIIEQIFNALFSVGMAALLFQYGKELSLLKADPSYAYAWGAAGGTIGTGIGALAALAFCIYTFYSYKKTFRKNIASDDSRRIRTYKRLTKILIFTSIPVVLSAAVNNCLDVVDSAIFNAFMSKNGIPEKTYAAIWGDYNSAFLLLVHLPVAISSALGAALVPSLASAFSACDQELCLKRIKLTVKVCAFIAIPASFGMMAIGGNLASVLFPGMGKDARIYLAVGGIAILFFSMFTVSNAILQGIDHLGEPVLNALKGLGIHIVVLILLMIIFDAGIFAVIISYAVYGAAVTIFNFRSIYKLTGYIPDPMKTILWPTACSGVMVLVCFLISFLVTRTTKGTVGSIIIIVLSIIIGGVLYLIGILAFGCLSREDLLEIPFGKKILKIASKIPFLKYQLKGKDD